jgi:hypothetical protein
MQHPVITEAQATDILVRRKFIHSVASDNSSSTTANERLIAYALRFVDSPLADQPLQLIARLERNIPGIAPRPKPGISLRWKGHYRIRQISHALRHDCLLNGVPNGHVKGWHEKIWTNTDEDKFIVDVNHEIGNTDLMTMIRFCCERWNIEPLKDSLRLGDQI